MARTATQTLWVTTVRPKEIDGQSFVPTAIRYNRESPTLIGQSALDTRDDNQTVNVGFKIDLGNVSPSSVYSREKFETGDGGKTAYEICNDFVTAFLSDIESELEPVSIDTPTIPAKIMVAEPLSFQVEDHSKQWLPNYRSNFRRMLSRYKEVDFLPEPFAVYQYYRYGLRIPHLQDQSKQIALILDFGGGTFDACVIESTKDGDVSIRGKHSKPLAAKSVPVGGFYVNRRLALSIVKRDLEGVERKLVDRYFRQYEQVKRGTIRRDVLRRECQVFMANFEKFEKLVEAFKVDLTSKITSWGLDDEAYDKIIIQRPKHPLRLGPWVDSELYGHQFRRVFVNEIWKNKLKDVIEGVLRIASDAIEGRNITTTLISGGSSNIRWLENLVRQDFAESLSCAQPVPISHSFQEVVANGLAIECARRYYSEEHSDGSEFMAVTYNPVKLYLSSDGGELIRDYQFRSADQRIDMTSAKPGDLIPSAQSLRHFFNQNLKWRVKLRRPPRQFLDYLFCKPSTDSLQMQDDDDEILEGAFNVEERTLKTSRNRFDNSIIVDLEVRSDGTTTPKFIYQAANERGGIAENSEVGRPFYIDMTTQSATSGRSADQYIGFDFGTSSSAVCTLNKAQISVIEARSASSEWKSITESLPSLPFPVAISVRRYLSSLDNSVAAARDAFEAGLAVMAYVTAAEACHVGRIGGTLKAFPHRAMSPLWALFNHCQRRLGKNGEFSKGLGRVLESQNEVTLFTEAIEHFTANKHGKLADDAVDWQRYVQLPLRVLLSGLDGFVFGRSMSSMPIPFGGGKHEGTFVVTNDNQPFIDTIKYTSEQSIDGSMALLVDRKSGRSISLSPFFFWFDRNKSGVQDCYMLDRFSSRSKEPTVKPCDRDEEVFADDLAHELRLSIESLLADNRNNSTMELEVHFVEGDAETRLE